MTRYEKIITLSLNDKEVIMIMKQTIELDIKDIKHIISKEFNVKEEFVTVGLREVYEGYGMGEHKNQEIYAMIRK